MDHLMINEHYQQNVHDMQYFEMKIFLAPLACLLCLFLNAQTSDIQIYSENQEPFSLKINGQQVSSLDDNTHDITGMLQGVNYDIIIEL